jgi:hypothetical protein
VASITLTPTSVTGGASSTGTVTLTGPAPSGFVVSLSSSNPAVASFLISGPFGNQKVETLTLTFPGGQNSANFAVTTKPVTRPTGVGIAVSGGGVTKPPTARLTVLPPALWGLMVSPNSITGGLHATGQASLTGPVAAGASVVIALSSNWFSTISSSYPVVVVPQSVTIVAGAASATFDVTTNLVPGEVRTTISASYEGVTKAALMTVTSPPNPVLTFTGAEKYQVSGQNFVRYKLAVTNHAAYPNAMFAPAPQLPPCGQNANSSRTWVNISDSVTKIQIYGFCAFNSSDDLVNLWFARSPVQAPPSHVVVVLDDRQMNKKYISNPVAIP